MMCYNVSIPLLMRQMNDVEENLNPVSFEFTDQIVIFCEFRLQTVVFDPRVSHHSPSPFTHSLQTFRSNMVRRKYGCFAVYCELGHT